MHLLFLRATTCHRRRLNHRRRVQSLLSRKQLRMSPMERVHLQTFLPFGKDDEAYENTPNFLGPWSVRSPRSLVSTTTCLQLAQYMSPPMRNCQKQNPSLDFQRPCAPLVNSGCQQELLRDFLVPFAVTQSYFQTQKWPSRCYFTSIPRTSFYETLSWCASLVLPTFVLSLL